MTWYSAAGMNLTDQERAQAERVHSLYQGCVAKIQVKAASQAAPDSQREMAEQLLARVLHRGIERAIQGIETSGSRNDADAVRAQLIQALQAQDGQSSQATEAGVWTRVLERDFGGVQYHTVVKEPWWIKKWWDSTLKVEVSSPRLPLATTVIDGATFGSAVRNA